ncbi:hypothetical protein PMG71_12680 [Roseofilum sp. BLCC_M154]|uniref:Uncharacterized protein n=1 Tax=Roseofilum acuticapitatum BLCC-M154 TaxID=3022444 RepID=A0ABT7AUL5_9CYAN|nr:hypothetical protein [Roseofilum acuticapitatum]MDJ1170287.1 hypothetical protein [Roseofilum acuticapitatum BLCC-M154]
MSDIRGKNPVSDFEAIFGRAGRGRSPNGSKQALINKTQHNLTMAKLPIEITVLVNQLKQQALDIVDESLAIELKVFEQFGETEQTIAALDEMKNAGEDAASAYSQLSTLQLQIAKIQPDVPSDVLKLLTKVIERTQLRIPALQRSIQEVQQEYQV